MTKKSVKQRWTCVNFHTSGLVSGGCGIVHRRRRSAEEHLAKHLETFPDSARVVRPCDHTGSLTDPEDLARLAAGKSARNAAFNALPRSAPGCCVDRVYAAFGTRARGCSDDTCMTLPAGQSCGTCVHHNRCTSLFGAKTENTVCDFFPRRFRPAEPLGNVAEPA